MTTIQILFEAQKFCYIIFINISFAIFFYTLLFALSLNNLRFNEFLS